MDRLEKKNKKLINYNLLLIAFNARLVKDANHAKKNLIDFQHREKISNEILKKELEQAKLELEQAKLELEQAKLELEELESEQEENLNLESIIKDLKNKNENLLVDIDKCQEKYDTEIFFEKDEKKRFILFVANSVVIFFTLIILCEQNESYGQILKLENINCEKNITIITSPLYSQINKFIEIRNQDKKNSDFSIKQLNTSIEKQKKFIKKQEKYIKEFEIFNEENRKKILILNNNLKEKLLKRKTTRIIFDKFKKERYTTFGYKLMYFLIYIIILHIVARLRNNTFINNIGMNLSKKLKINQTFLLLLLFTIIKCFVGFYTYLNYITFMVIAFSSIFTSKYHYNIELCNVLINIVMSISLINIPQLIL
jgi:hypothetical protein